MTIDDIEKARAPELRELTAGEIDETSGGAAFLAVAAGVLVGYAAYHAHKKAEKAISSLLH